jgi:hypothetical protein
VHVLDAVADTRQCDQALPACGQCTKAGRICPGYRNTVDLMFHDESRLIARRNKTQLSDHAEVQDVSGRRFNEQALIQVVAAAPVRLTDFVLYQPLNDLGVNFFMSTYVGDDPSVSQLFYLPKLYAQNSSSHPALQQSITATGLAGYAKTARRNDVKDAATRLYVSAIRSINAAISDPTAVVQDSTLMSVVMAAMFEVLVVPRLSDMRDANKHLDGAVAVALLMLKQKKQTDITYQIINATMQSMVINSWITHMPLPANFMQLKRRLGSQPRLHLHTLHSDFLDIVTDLIDFREALRDEVFKHPTDIIERALAVDEIFETFADTMPPHGRFQTYRILRQDVEQLAFNGYYHGTVSLSSDIATANAFCQYTLSASLSISGITCARRVCAFTRSFASNARFCCPHRLCPNMASGRLNKRTVKQRLSSSPSR